RTLAERDRRDSTRTHAPLRPADDAVVLDTTRLTLEAVVAEMERLVRAPVVPARTQRCETLCIRPLIRLSTGGRGAGSLRSPQNPARRGYRLDARDDGEARSEDRSR